MSTPNPSFVESLPSDRTWPRRPRGRTVSGRMPRPRGMTGRSPMIWFRNAVILAALAAAVADMAHVFG